MLKISPTEHPPRGRPGPAPSAPCLGASRSRPPPPKRRERTPPPRPPAGPSTKPAGRRAEGRAPPRTPRGRGCTKARGGRTEPPEERGGAARPGSAAEGRAGRLRGAEPSPAQPSRAAGRSVGAAGPCRGPPPQPAASGSAPPCWGAWRRRGPAGEVSGAGPGTENGLQAGASPPAGERTGGCRGGRLLRAA